MANPIPSYPKVLNLGAPYTHNALVGDVIIQEKVDGSQLRWGFDDKGEFHIGSKGREIHSDNQEGMFALAFTYLSKHPILARKWANTWFFGEYLCKPKHNCLAYDHTPLNNIVLFDCMYYQESGGLKAISWMTAEELRVSAKDWGVDLIPELWRGWSLRTISKS